MSHFVDFNVSGRIFQSYRTTAQMKTDQITNECLLLRYFDNNNEHNVNMAMQCHLIEDV